MAAIFSSLGLDTERTVLIAEMAWAHDGSIEHALAIADDVADAGFDVLNIHLTSLQDYMVPSYGEQAGTLGRVSGGRDVGTIYGHLEELQLSHDDWETLVAQARQRGLSLSCMCNDIPSVEQASGLAPDVLAIAPACLAEVPYLEAVAATRLPVMLGVGGARLGEIEAALTTLSAPGCGPRILQYGVQTYPTDPAALDLRWLGTLKRTFGLPVAYHDHTDADSPLAFDVPLVALGLGVAALEKHVTHDRAARGEDHESALSGPELRDFVDRVRVVELALGSGQWVPLTETELSYRSVVRKRAVAARAIAVGTALQTADVVFKRADDGIYPEELAALVGRVAVEALAPDDPVCTQSFR